MYKETISTGLFEGGLFDIESYTYLSFTSIVLTPESLSYAARNRIYGIEKQNSEGCKVCQEI